MERPREHAHRRYEDMAVSHVLGGLNSNDGRMFRSHLVDCQLCRARVGELRAIAHDLADVERDERRLAERRRVDTKPVEIDVDDAAPDQGSPPRRLFLLAVAGLLLLIGLMGWNFVLRSNTTRLEAQANLLERTAIGAQFGEQWNVTYPEASNGVRGAVSYDAGDLTLLLDNAEDTRHVLYLYNSGGDMIGDPYSLTPSDGRWVGMLDDVSPEAVRLELTRGAAATNGPAGVTVLEAARQ